MSEAYHEQGGRGAMFEDLERHQRFGRDLPFDQEEDDKCEDAE